MAKNIVICCDGTGNEFNGTNSNVVKLYSNLVISKDQVGYYHPGVGTMGSPTASGPVEKQWTRIQGLAVGSGLLDNVGDAYRYLMQVYEDEDRIFLFGFSRGAYTVRVLSLVLHVFGVLWRGNEGLIRYIIRMFAKKSRDAKGNNAKLGLFEEFKHTFSRRCSVHFVGVWDTVDAVGWLWDPVILPFAGQNPSMKIGRHALAIDERRSFYEPKLWGPPVRSAIGGKLQDIKQVWFAGAHSDVGGSYPEAEGQAADISLKWMLQEACAAGLLISPRNADKLLHRARQGITATLHNSLHGLWWLMEFLPRKDDCKHTGQGHWRWPDFGERRVIPEGAVIHESVLERMNANCQYRPPNFPREYTIERELSCVPIGSLDVGRRRDLRTRRLRPRRRNTKSLTATNSFR